MSKIIAAVNAMISNQDKISSVIRHGEEFFFMYADKYKWSIVRDDEDYSLFFYPGPEPLSGLANIRGTLAWRDQDINFVAYSTVDLKTREARESLSELYRIVKEKLYGLDGALDDIISGGGKDTVPF